MSPAPTKKRKAAVAGIDKTEKDVQPKQITKTTRRNTIECKIQIVDKFK